MAEERRRLFPVVIGIALTAGLLLLLAYLANLRRAEQAEVPDLAVLAPITDVPADSPLVIRFTSSRPLKSSAMGWGYKGLHLHAWINDVQHMPAAADLRQIAGGAYEWTLADVMRGNVTVRLGWADAAHRPLSAGLSETVSTVLK